MKKTNDLLLALSSAPDNPGAFLLFITRHVRLRYDILNKAFTRRYLNRKLKMIHLISRSSCKCLQRRTC